MWQRQAGNWQVAQATECKYLWQCTIIWSVPGSACVLIYSCGKHFKFNWKAAVWPKIKWAESNRPTAHSQTDNGGLRRMTVGVGPQLLVVGIVLDGFFTLFFFFLLLKHMTRWSDCQAGGLSMCLGRVSAHLAISCMQISFWTCCNLLLYRCQC